MISIELLRNDFEKTCKKLQTRQKNFEQLKKFKSLDSEYRNLLTQLQKLNASRNIASKEIAELKSQKAPQEKVNSIIKKVTNYKKDIIEIEQKISKIDQELKDILLTIPNIPDQSVPIGKDENDNLEISRWGKPRIFNFKPLPHWELAQKKEMVDFERAVKISASRYTIYKNAGAQLIRALQSFTLKENIKSGFKELLPPVVVNQTSLIGTGNLPKFREDLYKIENENMFLSPTGEVQMSNMFRDEIISIKDLPYHFTTSTSCFRSEAGSAGRDTKGVIRQHQFYKTEMVKIVDPKTSWDELESMTSQAEKILQLLKLPYRRILLCTGDMGFSSAKTYDLEVWLPSYNAYKEISSCSNCTDFQARNLKMRYKDEHGDVSYVHTLNGSGLAIDRLWAAVVENYQTKAGEVLIPKKLRSYFRNSFFKIKKYL